MTYYKQCVLKKGNSQTVSWIPEQYAKVDKILSLKEDDGWQVLHVGAVRLSESVVVEQERDYKEFSYHMQKFGGKNKKSL